MTLTRRQVQELLAANGLHLKRALGQNFVVDPNTVRRVARLAGVGPGDRVLEVGAGLGSLTIALAETGASVTAVEIDRGLVPVLRSVVEPVGAVVVEGDALRLDWGALLASASGPVGPGGGAAQETVAGPVGPGGGAAQETVAGTAGWVLVANLPYNVATPLIADLLDGVPAIERMLVMVQREVGERLAARPGDDAYGAVSVKVAYWARALVVGRVPASVFLPPPSVESVLVEVRRRASPAVGPDVDPAWLFRLVRAGFGHRRKMLRGALAGLVGPDEFACAGVRPDARAEELDVDAWGRLARCSPPPS